MDTSIEGTVIGESWCDYVVFAQFDRLRPRFLANHSVDSLGDSATSGRNTPSTAYRRLHAPTLQLGYTLLLSDNF